MDIVIWNRVNRSELNMANFIKSMSVWDLVEGYQERQVYIYSNEVQYPQIDVTLILERQSNLDKKIVVLPLLCTASLLLATFWTHPVSGVRLKLNSACMRLLIIIFLHCI